MDMSIYNIIKGPVVSNKAYKANRANKVILRVHIDANSVMIKEAVEKFFNVKVAKVNTLIRKKKSHRVKRILFEGSCEKRAYITLKEGYKINLFDQVETNNVQQEG
jgi:large subunit ribosomal protein L23